jgi:hypothetical protein
VWLKQQFRNPLREAASKAVSRFAEGWAAWTALALLIRVTRRSRRPPTEAAIARCGSVADREDARL